MSIRDDRDVIVQLDSLMQSMDEMGLPPMQMRRFFDVGEWLLCFEGALSQVEGDPDHPLRSDPAFKALEAYFQAELRKGTG
jgi:hypothetical protein